MPSRPGATILADWSMVTEENSFGVPTAPRKSCSRVQAEALKNAPRRDNRDRFRPVSIDDLAQLGGDLIQRLLKRNERERTVRLALQRVQQAGRAVMQLDCLEALEAGEAQGLLVLSVGADADQLLVVIDRQHHGAMAHADAAEGQFLVRGDDRSPGFPGFAHGVSPCRPSQEFRDDASRIAP